MSFSERFARVFRSVLPAPFTIAIALTLITFLLALIFTRPESVGWGSYSFSLLQSWEENMWDVPLLGFALQMMLMLVLGHSLALTRPVNRVISMAVRYCDSTPKAAALVTLLTIAVALFNWGLGLIFGAIFARKVGEYAASNGIKLNYPLIGAAGYSGLMVWHGGVSGSSLIKVAEPGHLSELMDGKMDAAALALLPESIGFDQTVFSGMNITVSICLLLLLPLGMYWLGSRSPAEVPQLKARGEEAKEENTDLQGAEKLDHAQWLGISLGMVILGLAGYKAFHSGMDSFLGFFTPNNINLLLLGLALLLHGSFSRFLRGVDEAIGGAAGILIQFPLYFGILGIMNGSGLVLQISEFFVANSNPTSYPILTFFSAGLVNIFVPSGGGQWVVQGPIIINAASSMDLPLAKNIMALAYGPKRVATCLLPDPHKRVP